MTTARTEPALPADLAPLVPRRSPLRNIALVVLGVLVLVGAWFSPALLKPSLTGSEGGGWSVELPEAGVILTVSQLHPDAWPHTTITSIEPLPGATPTAAWVFLEPNIQGFHEPPATEPRDHLAEVYPGVDFPVDGNLPARVQASADGASFDDGGLVIAIAWQIDDCEVFRGVAANWADDHEVHAVVRSALDTESRAKLGYAASPMTFVQYGSAICDGSDPS